MPQEPFHNPSFFPTFPENSEAPPTYSQSPPQYLPPPSYDKTVGGCFFTHYYVNHTFRRPVEMFPHNINPLKHNTGFTCFTYFKTSFAKDTFSTIQEHISTGNSMALTDYTNILPSGMSVEIPEISLLICAVDANKLNTLEWLLSNYYFNASLDRDARPMNGCIRKQSLLRLFSTEFNCFNVLKHILNNESTDQNEKETMLISLCSKMITAIEEHQTHPHVDLSFLRASLDKLYNSINPNTFSQLKLLVCPPRPKSPKRSTPLDSNSFHVVGSDSPSSVLAISPPMALL